MKPFFMGKIMKSYLITDPKYYTNNIDIFKNRLEYILSQFHIDMVCFRDKQSDNIDDLAKVFIDISKKYNIENIYINSNIELAYKYHYDGVHLTSTQFESISKAKELGLKVIISCHNDIDIEKAIYHKADTITYSPIFNTPNKGEPKGIEKLNRVVNKYNIPIIALGGIISDDQILQIQSTKCYGFASIRYFIPNQF